MPEYFYQTGCYAACFLAYLLLGFGLFHFLKLLSSFRLLKEIQELFFLALLLLFAVLSFRDVWRFRKSRRADHVTLQLPGRIKEKIHAIMKDGLKYRYLVPGIFFIGISVTLLEGVCTGQIYVPTLVILTREFGPGTHYFGYLLLYNFMFILAKNLPVAQVILIGEAIPLVTVTPTGTFFSTH